MFKFVNLDIRFEHAPLFEKGQVIQTGSGTFEYTRSSVMPDGTRVNTFKKIDNGEVIKIHDSKFENWYYKNFLRFALQKNHDGKETFMFQNQRVMINGVVHPLVGLYQSLRPRFYTDVAGNENIHAVVNAIVQLFMYQRFNTPVDLHEDYTKHDIIESGVSYIYQHGKQLGKMKYTNSCRGCQALKFYRDPDGNHGVAQAESMKYSCPYVCGYTGDNPSPERIEALRDETGRGYSEGVDYDLVLDACKHYVPRAVTSQLEGGEVYTHYISAPLKYRSTYKNGTEVYRIPGFDISLRPINE